MPKPTTRAQSRYARDAIALLGTLIRSARIDRGITAAELAERAGVSRALLHRAEAGDPGCSIGAVFEIAAVLGIPLFEDDPGRLAGARATLQDRLTLLPRAARPRAGPIDDDF